MNDYLRPFYLLLFVLSMSCLQGCATGGYSAEAIEARVVDADTGQPVEGVVVDAFWVLRQGSFAGGGVPPPPLKILETVTDKNGRFYLPAWGPIPNTTGGAYFWGEDPLLIFFKRGYDILGHENRVTGEPNEEPLRKSDWNHQTIRIEKFKADMQSYAKRLDLMQGEFPYYVGYGCGWKRIPRMTAELYLLGKAFESHGVKIVGYPYQVGDLRRYGNQTGCGAEEFLSKLGYHLPKEEPPKAAPAAAPATGLGIAVPAPAR